MTATAPTRPATLRRSLRSRIAAALLAACAAPAAFAQAAPREPAPVGVTRTPLAADHPLVGSWRIDLPGLSCHETYEVRADGTSHITSGRQVAESEFEISAEPDAAGFYRWADRVVSDNGEPDCMGEIGEVGHVAVNYIRLSRNGDQFLMCEQADLRTCIGPFRRERGI
jgi:hypothetical protein